MTLNSRDVPQGQKYVTQFFKVLHCGLTSSDQVIFECIFVFYYYIEKFYFILFCRKLLIQY